MPTTDAEEARALLERCGIEPGLNFNSLTGVQMAALLCERDGVHTHFGRDRRLTVNLFYRLITRLALS